MISEEKKKEIEKEAQNILKEFGKSLSKVKLVSKKKKNDSVGGFRKELNPNNEDEDFRVRMFRNAPNKNENCVIAEKKEW